ncbi:unknown [Clostridium sp. CAG:729]|nr:unknown [Clostridium sp. CAG:729]
MFERYVNINPSDSTCNGSSVDTSTTEFSDLTPDIILRNGIRLYNLHQDPAIISQLQIIGIDTETAEKDTNQKGYIIYADVDGSKGNSVLWEDVYPFYITLSGRVIPAYDRGANPDGSGGDSKEHLSVSIKNETFSAEGHRIFRWLSRSVSFKEGACQSGFVSENTQYCVGMAYNQACNSVNSNCELKPIKPLKFF